MQKNFHVTLCLFSVVEIKQEIPMEPDEPVQQIPEPLDINLPPGGKFNFNLFRNDFNITLNNARIGLFKSVFF